MRLIRSFFAKEVSNFRKLHKEAQRLMSSIMLFNLINPIFTIFINAFLWRQSQDFILIAFFNLIIFLLIPCAFYLNGFLLRRISLNRLSFFSVALQGFAAAALIFLNQISYLAVFIFGIINGLGMGMYWANRNLWTLRTTQSSDRLYFSSIEASADIASKVVIPLLIGLFITFGSIIHLYSPLQGYQMIAIGIIVVTLSLGLVMRGNPIQVSVGSMFLKQTSKSWQRFQLIKFFYGLSHGILTFVPTLMVLYLVGNENSLGIIQSLSAIIGSMTIYLLGQYLHIRHRLILFTISVTFLIVGGLTFGILYSALAVAIFFACQALSHPFLWVAMSSLNYDIIEQKKKDEHYAYVCDQELYLGTGRILAILAFMGIIYLFSAEFALRFSPLLVAASQLGLLLFAKSSEKHHAKNEVIIKSSIDQEKVWPQQ